MSLWELARKELYLRRYPTLLTLCIASLLMIAAASMLPRSWTARAVLELQVQPPEFALVESRLRSRVETPQAAGVQRASAVVSGSSMTVSLTAASRQDAVGSLSALLASMVDAEIELLRARTQDVEHEVQGELEESQARIRGIEQRINDELGHRPEGGESALGARLGQLQGEREALETELRGGEALRQTLASRIAALDVQIAETARAQESTDAVDRDIVQLRSRLAEARSAVPPDAAATEALELELSLREVDRAAILEANAAVRARIDRQLKPEREQFATRLELLDDDTASKSSRRKEIDKLLAAASAELATLQQRSQALRDLQREYEDATALNRQIKLRAQEVQSDLLLRVNAASLPFAVTRQPDPPDHPDGIPAWVIALCSLALGALLAGVLNLSRILVDDRVRSAESVRLDAQVEVLGVIPEYVSRQDRSAMRWRATLCALLVAGTAAAHLAYVALF